MELSMCEYGSSTIHLIPTWSRRLVSRDRLDIQHWAREGGTVVLTGFDEYPFHQITQTFAAVAGSDPSWNDGHYVCAADQAGTVAFTSNLRLYSNNDVLAGC